MNPTKKGEYVFNLKSIKSFKIIKEYETELFDIWFVEINGFLWRRIRYEFIIDGFTENEQNYCLNSCKYVNIIEDKEVDKNITLKSFGFALLKK